MDYNGFKEGFEILYNNVTSNQAPGLNVHEMSLFLTKAENEIVRNHFNAASKGNTTGQGFDDTAIRQSDFSSLMATKVGPSVSEVGIVKSHKKGKLFMFPENVFIVINETYRVQNNDLQVIPLRYDEYVRNMSKPFKRPAVGQAWRIIGSGDKDNKIVELVAAPEFDSVSGEYIVRFIRKPKPIIVGDLDELNIDGYVFGDPTEENPMQIKGCELDSSLHDQILQRAVELAKVAWTATGQDNAQMVLQAGQRSE
jgi:hypothetical protein